MAGRTLREAIAIALESVPSVELAAGDEMQRSALRGFLLGWVKQYGFVRGVIFEDHNLDAELAEVIAELRQTSVPLNPPFANPLDAPCHICNAKPGAQCSNIISSAAREQSHAGRGVHDQRPRRSIHG